MRVSVSATRYSAVAIILHWTIAAAIGANLLLGWWMSRAIDVVETQARAITVFQLHKSLGLTVLGLSLLRLAWRLLHRPPPLPAAMPAWERFAAKATHWAFYALMIVVPLSGWTYVSAQWRDAAPLSVPTLWFWLFQVPHLFDAQALTDAARKSIADRNFAAHFYLAWSMAVLLALHIAAALKHHFLNRDAVLVNMLPATTSARIGAVALILMAAASLGFAVFKTPGTTGAAPTSIGDLPDATWSVSADSAITFSGTHAGTPFQGRFTRWRAGIRLDPADLSGSSVTAIIETGSARDGDPLHEETLPQAEWFDIANHPTATYRSTAIRPHAEGFEVEGTLTIKGRALTQPPLLLKIEGDRLSISGRTTIKRVDANLGMESDPDAAYVSGDIVVDVRLSATPVR